MPNITRNAIVNCAEMVTYDIIKEKILEFNLLTGKVLEPRKCPSIRVTGISERILPRGK